VERRVALLEAARNVDQVARQAERPVERQAARNADRVDRAGRQAAHRDVDQADRADVAQS
jgi:hypothetical protein